MKTYEKQQFENFISHGVFTVNDCLTRNILKLEFCDNLVDIVKPKKKKDTSSAAVSIKQQLQCTGRFPTVPLPIDSSFPTSRRLNMLTVRYNFI